MGKRPGPRLQRLQSLPGGWKDALLFEARTRPGEPPRKWHPRRGSGLPKAKPAASRIESRTAVETAAALFFGFAAAVMGHGVEIGGGLDEAVAWALAQEMAQPIGVAHAE